MKCHTLGTFVSKQSILPYIICIHSPRPIQGSYLRFWPLPSPAACSSCSSLCCPGTSERCWGQRRRSRVAWGCMCRSSVRLLAPQRRPCGGLLSAAPGRSQKPPQMDFCPASSFAAADRWARETLCRRDTSQTKIRNRLQIMPVENLVLTPWWTPISDTDCNNCYVFNVSDKGDCCLNLDSTFPPVTVVFCLPQ